jgi:sulfate adenylyltransferase
MAVQERNADLVPVHGGLDAPVDRVVPLSQRSALRREASSLPSIRVTRADLSTVHRIADGTLSPLEGPMGAAAWHRVLDEGVIERAGRRYAWGIPLALAVTDAEARGLASGGSAALRAESGELVAVLDQVECFDWDKPKYVRGVYGTERLDHPGGHMTAGDERTKLVGGGLRALAFQTRNPLHRAHEYALVAGVERLTREGFFTGVVLNPLVGELKGDDVPAATRMRCYRELHDHKLLGEGDKDEALWTSVGYDLTEVFEVLPLDIRMFYGGPKEAIMHAVYRQNHGFSDLVVGRKHADAPYDDGSPIWGDFDAQDVFDHLPGELRLRPCKIGFAAYYESIGRVDLTDNHPGEKPYAISGTKVREQLRKGEKPDPRILRPEIAEILIEAYRD